MELRWGKQLELEQIQLWAAGPRKGGARGGVWSVFDVDAFTFNTHRCEVQFDGGSWRQLSQGVWTKLNSVQAATCYMASGTIRCQIDSAL